MPAQTVADHLLGRLREWGVDTVFGYPGDGINGLMAAWGRADNHPRFVQARHEEMAAFEAVGYAKFTGRMGVCVATSGPGAIHLLNGLYDAKLDHVPVLAIIGQTNRSAMGGSYQQEVDLLSLFKDVASDYVQMVTVAEQLPNVADRAIRTALGRRAPTAIVLPADVQELQYSAPTHEFTMVPSSLGISWPELAPDSAALHRAAEILNAGSRVAILAGSGARGAAEELEQVADALAAGVAKALLGKDVLSDELPYVTGSIGLLGTRPSYEMMRGADTLLTVGSSFPYTQFMPEFDQARAVQIDHDPTMIGMRYPYQVNLVGDAATTLRALLPLLTRKKNRSWRESIEADVARWWEAMAMEAGVEADPINPMRLFSELSPRLPDDAIVTADSGSTANWYARLLRFRGNIRGSLSGNLATMGPGVPYGIGAKFSCPHRPVIVFAGDGAMQMNGLAELITVKRYWEQWRDPRLIIAVLHNDDLNQVTWEMRAMSGAPKFVESQRLPDVDYAGFAASLGLRAIAVDKPGDIAPAWERALSAEKPTLLDVRCDPNVPPIPPHANGGYQRKQAIRVIRAAAESDIRWFEEPVSSDDLAGLREVRDAVLPDVAAGEYGSDLAYFPRMCAAGAVDCVPADASRCGGITEWLPVAAVAAAHNLEISGHCAPNLHAHVAMATPNLRHLEWFHDHVRIEQSFLKGALDPRGGAIRPDRTAAGTGLSLRREVSSPYQVSSVVCHERNSR